MSGSVTNGSTIDNTTCDATRSVLIPSRPTAIATTSEGMIPRHRVTRRVSTGCSVVSGGNREDEGEGEGEDGGERSGTTDGAQEKEMTPSVLLRIGGRCGGGRRTDIDHWMKPSETICAASVAIIDELCPAARSASAKSVAAAVKQMARWRVRQRRSSPARMVEREKGVGGAWRHNDWLTCAKAVAQQRVRVEERRWPARGCLGPKEEHGGGEDEDPAYRMRHEEKNRDGQLKIQNLRTREAGSGPAMRRRRPVLWDGARRPSTAPAVRCTADPLPGPRYGPRPLAAADGETVPHSALITTASPSRLTTMSMIPW